MGWTSIYQLLWCELQGYKVLTHCHLFNLCSTFKHVAVRDSSDYPLITGAIEVRQRNISNICFWHKPKVRNFLEPQTVCEFSQEEVSNKGNRWKSQKGRARKVGVGTKSWFWKNQQILSRRMIKTWHWQEKWKQPWKVITEESKKQDQRTKQQRGIKKWKSSAIAAIAIANVATHNLSSLALFSLLNLAGSGPWLLCSRDDGVIWEVAAKLLLLDDCRGLLYFHMVEGFFSLLRFSFITGIYRKGVLVMEPKVLQLRELTSRQV